MNGKTSIESRICDILSKVLNKEIDGTADAISTTTIPEWDSVAQVQIVVALESEFGIEADTALIEAHNLNLLVKAVKSKI